MHLAGSLQCLVWDVLPPWSIATRSKLTGLRRLEVCSGYLTEAGVAHLGALAGLQHLSLAQVRLRLRPALAAQPSSPLHVFQGAGSRAC